MPIDYSKWKDIEVSDDEDDTHPNIDTPSLYRWRHQARLERMAEKKLEKEKLEKDKQVTNKKMEELEKKLASASTDCKSDIQKELDDVKAQEEAWRKKEAELEEKERLEPWNVDTIGHEAFSTSRINKITDKKPEVKKTDEQDTMEMSEFFEKNDCLLEKIATLKGGAKATEAYLLEHPHMASEYTANWLTIEALNAAIFENEEKMKILAQQCIIIQYLLELSKSLNAVATNAIVQKQFFKKFESAEPVYMQHYHDEVKAFEDRLRIRAETKRQAAMEEAEAEEKEQRIKASPGGIDPQEVFEELPVEMRECFEKHDIEALKGVAQKMDEEVFKYHFDRCIASGLWVPGNAADEAEEEEEVGETSESGPGTSS
uniref:Hsp90 chaperone protein kinase-targeting subunit n=1 Tax=Caenorhabditis tropicalis TaxID=1561998 RepID=A0A1I7TG90_9PELO